MPGEHDTSNDDGKQYLERYGKGTKGRGWYSFDQKGIHFVGLVNVGAQEGLGQAWAGSTRVARSRRERAVCEYADRAVCAHPALEPLSGVGLGHRGQRSRPSAT